MKTRKDERGFLLLEVLLLCLVLLSLSSIFWAYRLSAKMHAANQWRVAALYLAQEEMAYMIEKGRQGQLHEGRWPWLGAQEALSLNRGSYTAYADAVKEGPGDFYRVNAVLSWNHFGQDRQVKLERLVRNIAGRNEEFE